jgi:drug/metabolite transporter (DMT)-like permease
MHESIQLALIAMVFYGLSDWMYKSAASEGVQSHHFMAIQSMLFTPGILLYGYVTQSFYFEKSFFCGMTNGFITFLALYNFLGSLKSGAVSVIVPIFRLSFIITTILAVFFLDERFTLLKFLALCASLCAVFLLLGGEKKTSISQKALIQVIIATVLMGVASFIYKVGTLWGGTPATIITGQVSIFFPLALGFAFYKDRGFNPIPVAWKYGASASIFFLIALILLLSGLKIGEASTLVPISQMGFIVTALMGYFLLKEPFTVRKYLGLACAFSALIFLSIS